MARLWLAAIVAALIPWGYKLALDRGSPVFSAHESVIKTKAMAFVLLAFFGLVYLAITAALRIPEAANVIDRGRRLLRLGRRAK
jgi:hypothetical protein